MATTSTTAVLIILLINFIVAAAIFIQAFFQKESNRSTWFMLSWFVFIVPFLGILYILLSMFFCFTRRKKYIDLSEISFNHQREAAVLPPEPDTEMNYVPIQDAMAVSDSASLRKLLLDTLRNNAKKTVSSVTAVLNSKDTEASHYAASVITDSLSEFRSTAQSMLIQMNRNPEDVEINLLTLEYIYEVLSLKIMTDVEQEAYIYTLNNVAENLYSRNLWYMTATHYLWMTDMFLTIKDYNMSKLWASRASLYRPNMLDTYKANLHLYYAQRDQAAFFQCLAELKNSKIPIDEETMNIIRLYGDAYRDTKRDAYQNTKRDENPSI
jgi:hypothetical protein